MTVKADFASPVDKGKRLNRHISGRTVICRPTTHHSSTSGRLAYDVDFKNNMQRFSDANDSWTQFITIGSVGMNTHGREAQMNARKVGCH